MYSKLTKLFPPFVYLPFFLIPSFFLSTAQAATWTETDEAADLISTAQLPTGNGSLTSITGTISTNFDADLYKIYISNPVNFSALVSGGNEDEWDSAVALFNNDGLGVYYNDDAIFDNGQAGLPSNHSSGPQTPSIYYLAIFDDDQAPLSGSASTANDLIFPQSDYPYTQILGPVGPGGSLPLAGWGALVTEVPLNGTYSIALTGVSFVPEPETYAMLLVGLGLIGVIVRRKEIYPRV